MNKSRIEMKAVRIIAALGLCTVSLACSDGGGGSDGPSTLSPPSVNVPIGGRTQFSLSPAQAASWSVDDQVGGSDTVGYISLIGGYTAPFIIPSGSTAVPGGTPDPTVTVRASAATNSAAVTLVRRFIDDGSVSVCAAVCGPVAVLASDLNSDGYADVTTANAANGTVSLVLRSNGGTAFSVSQEILVSTTAEPQALDAALFDGNQPIDLVIADADPVPAVRTWLGDGDGTFSDKKSVGLPAGSRPLSIGTGRFDNDSFRDVVVADFAGDVITVLRGNGNGEFLSQASRDLSTNGQLSASPLGIAVADFNNDTFDDIAVANNAAGTVAVFLAIGDAFAGLQSEQTYLVAGGPSAIVATDLDLDGFPDLAVTTISGGLVLMLNKGTPPGVPTFNDPPATTYPTGAEPVAVAAGDFNQDQFEDVVVVNRTDATIAVYLSHGDGTLTWSETYSVGALPQAVAVGDFNGDGWSDLAVANSGDDTVTILRNRGDATAP